MSRESRVCVRWAPPAMSPIQVRRSRDWSSGVRTGAGSRCARRVLRQDIRPVSPRRGDRGRLATVSVPGDGLATRGPLFIDRWRSVAGPGVSARSDGRRASVGQNPFMATPSVVRDTRTRPRPPTTATTVSGQYAVPVLLNSSSPTGPSPHRYKPLNWSTSFFGSGGSEMLYSGGGV